MKCQCGKGKASQKDGLCRFCREKNLDRRIAKKYIKHRGDGISYKDYQKVMMEYYLGKDYFLLMGDCND